MNNATSLLIKRGWNRRRLTDEDFVTWCEEEEVIVREVEMSFRGLYLIRDGESVILLNQRLNSIERQIVQWHEFGHHLLHVPDARFFCYGTLNKAEYQAHLIAAVALIPKPDLRKPITELQEEGYPFELLQFRGRVFDQFKI